jgi:hypothetical protein
MESVPDALVLLQLLNGWQNARTATFCEVGSNQGSSFPDAQWRIGERQRSCLIAEPQRKNPPRISAGGFLARQLTLNKTPYFAGPVKRRSK